MKIFIIGDTRFIYMNFTLLRAYKNLVKIQMKTNKISKRNDYDESRNLFV